MPLTLPNSDTNPVLQEMLLRLEQGLTVTISFGGDSMLPLINGKEDVIDLAPLPKFSGSESDTMALKPGYIYLFRQGHRFVIHRLLFQRKGTLYFQGDNNLAVEEATIADVLAQLTAIRRPDGTVVDCRSAAFLKSSRPFLRRRRCRLLIRKFFSKRMLRVFRPIYFILLAVLMWAPLNGLGIPLDNFVFGIRLDHLLHASVYIPCAVLLFPLKHRQLSSGRPNRKPLAPLFAAIAIALLTETVQYLLPYRGFDINDLVANFLGVTLGWMLVPRPHKVRVTE